jgi:hypothetical protein
MAKKETGETTIQSAYDNPQFKKDNPNGLKVSFEYDVFETYDEVRKDLSENDIIEMANTRNKNNARSAAIADATKAYKPDPNSPEVRRDRMIKDALKGNPKLNEAQATALVDSILNATV